MNTTKHPTIPGISLCLADAANHRPEEISSERTRKRALLISLVLMTAGVASAADIPSGLTGLWRFEDSAAKLQASLGVDLTTSAAGNSFWYLGPWTMIGVPGNAGLYAEGGCVQERSWDYLTVNPSFTANGGGSYVNQYTIAIDYVQTSAYDVNNSLFQTAWGGNDNDGDLFIAPGGTIGVDDVGYSSLTFDTNKWHRIVWSVDNGNFFRVYVDGTNYLDGAGQAVDGRFSLYPDRFNLFADNDWQDAWGLVGTVMTWNRALTSEEIASMGGWIDGADMPTALMFTSEVPQILSVSPANGETNVAPDIAYEARIRDPVRVIDTNTVQLLLDGVPASPLVMHQGAMVVVKLGGGLFQGGTTHTYTLIAGASGIYSTNEVTFTVQNYTSYEWRFTQGDLATDLGNGVMDYADAGTPGITSFGTTDGSTVPHINGTPAKYMHVPAFTDAFGGYVLSFNDTGPNAPTGAYVNRYTVLFDVMVPEPLGWTPFFNTDPNNTLYNDADLYVAPDGSVGISAIYSTTNVVASNAWYRIAFVADLANSTMAFYVNGAQVATGSQTDSGLDGRWALYSNLDPGPDLLLFNENYGDGNKYTHELYVSSVAFTDRVLGEAELAALGGPSASGILVGSFAPRPTLTIQASGGGATVSWPANYVGYALEQTDSLTTPVWKAVAGITNNTVNVVLDAAPKFFRLVQ
jgi:hypothetical protein